MDAQIKSLAAEGWLLDGAAVSRHLADEGAQGAKTRDLQSFVLNSDLKHIGAPSLPDDINRADSRRLQGPIVLQLSEVLDISRPSRLQDVAPEGGARRLLRLRLTDGHKTCTAVEYTAFTELKSSTMVPGIKLKLMNPLIRCGVLLLEPKTVEILGGTVDRLAEAWITQQMYGGTGDRPVGEGDAAEMPPSFQHYDPSTAVAKASNVSTLAKGKKRKDQVDNTVLGAQGTSNLTPKQGGTDRGPEKRPGARAGNGSSATAPIPSPAAPAALQRSAQQSKPYTESSTTTASGHTSATPGAPLEQQKHQRQEDVSVPAASSRPSTSSAARQKLQEKLAAHQEETGRYGRRGGGGGRRGRFREEHNADDSRTMTLEEWESKRAGEGMQSAAKAVGHLRSLQPSGPGGFREEAQGKQQAQGVMSDEDIARRLQQQMDMEDMGGRDEGPHAGVDLNSSIIGMFSYTGNNEDGEHKGVGMRGRGRGRGRVRGGRSRRRGRPQGQ